MQQADTSKRHEANRVSLEELGFGTDSILMTDPKLFLDSAFLAIVTAEFRQELGAKCCRQALIEIGRHHGLRDATRTIRSESRTDLDQAVAAAPSGPNLSIKFSGTQQSTDGLTLRGSWPEAHESLARLSRLGTSTLPSCHLSTGYTAGWLAEIYDAEAEVKEIACRSKGDRFCEFEVQISGLEPHQKEINPDSITLRPRKGHIDQAPRAEGEPPIDRAAADTNALDANNPAQRLPALPREESPIDAASPEGSLYSRIDPQDDAVHAWGPVMVLPFTDPDVADRTLETLEGESFTRDIKVVVIDLRGLAINFEQFAESIERILKRIDRWHAQAILAGVTEANQASVEAFSGTCLVCRHKLSEAIAMGFQIAEAQRHAL